MPDEAVNGAPQSEGMPGRRARVRQMALAIDPKHAHTLPQTSGSIRQSHRKKTPLFLRVCLQGGCSGEPILELKVCGVFNRSRDCAPRYPPAGHPNHPQCFFFVFFFLITTGFRKHRCESDTDTDTRQPLFFLYIFLFTKCIKILCTAPH